MQHALASHKPVLLLNLGPTRADPLLGTNPTKISKVEISSGDVLGDVVRQLWCVWLIPSFPLTWVGVTNSLPSVYSGSQVEIDPMVQYLLSAGVVTHIEGR